MNGLEIWHEIELGEGCENCSFYRVTRDAYGTGDSPAEHDCTAASWQQCTRVEDYLRDEAND